MTTPRLTIGLPVYNGENYLAEAIESLLAQTYRDFELLISDNASYDRTDEICRQYAASDDRVRYVRQPRNIGAAPNHNFLVSQAHGELFKWAAHDDLFAPDLVARCVDLLDTHPDAVLAHSYLAIVNEFGEVSYTYDYALATDSADVATRFRDLLFTDGGDDFYGVTRTAVMRRIAPHGSYHNAGRKLVAELALHGRFLQAPDVMFFRRDHPGRGDRLGSVREVCRNLDPRRAGHSTARLMSEYVASYFTAVARAPLSTADKRRCRAVLIGWLSDRTVMKPVHAFGGTS